jgi:hypothetical protein
MEKDPMLVQSRSKIITLGLLGAMMALLIVGLMYTQKSVQANDGSNHVPSGAVIAAGSDVAPIFECKWELPDMTIDQNSPLAPTARTNQDVWYPDPYEVEYEHATLFQMNSAHGAHDDDAGGLTPYATGAAFTLFPCEGPPTVLPSMPEEVAGMISVRPIAHDPADAEVPQRMVQLWAALDHSLSLDKIDDVRWLIYEPIANADDDWKFKIKVHGTRVGVSDLSINVADPYLYNAAGQIIGCCKQNTDHDNDALAPDIHQGDRLKNECAALGTSSAQGSMFEAAFHTGQVSSEAIDDVNIGMIAKCMQAEKAIYYAKFSIDKDQACGIYKIVAQAHSGTAKSTFVNYIRVECFTSLSLDFAAVQWLEISPGSSKVVSGDFVWDDSIADAIPGVNPPFGATVHNGGNHPMGIKIKFDELLEIDPMTQMPIVSAVGNGINKFDACFGKYTVPNIICVGRGDVLPGDMFPQDSIDAGDWTLFGPGPIAGLTPHDNGFQILCANEFGKLDLSIHPSKGLNAAEYRGEVHIMAYNGHNTVVSTTARHCEEDGSHLHTALHR